MDRPPIERAMSTDVVLDIVLSHLNARDLLTCRKVSKFWNKAASSVLRKRSTMIKNVYGGAQLMDLQDCIEKSSDFPFAGLKFPTPWSLWFPEALDFFRNHGARFTRLHLRTHSKTRREDLAKFVNHLPRLSILEAGFSRGPVTAAWLRDSAAGREDRSILNLPSLRTLKTSLSLNKDVLYEICSAASPSLRIECLDTTYGMLKAFKRAGKLQAVSVMNVNLFGDDDGKVYPLRVEKLLSTESPALTKLDYRPGGSLSMKGLQKILFSSQHTLKELCLYKVCPSQFSSECPVLANLTKLRLRIADHSYEYVFQGRQGHKFPALRDLELEALYDGYDPSSANFSDGLFIVPSLTTIGLHGAYAKEGIEDLARSFPNVTEIRFNVNTYIDRWLSKHNQVDIWSVGAFKFLEKLKIWHFIVKPPTKNYLNMDSFLTGIPAGTCEELRKNSQHNRMDSPPFNDVLRDSPSILQLKNLKELIICVKPDGGLEELPDEPPFISMVSVWYALQMMPYLEAKFVYDYTSLSHRFEEEEKGDKAVKMLKAAFKRVQPYVELEPFFY